MSIIKSILKYGFFILFLLGSYFLIRINTELSHKPSFELGYNQDLLKQLIYLKQQRELGAPDNMQELFPEGFMFFECLYGITWLEFSKQLNHYPELKELAKVEVEKSLTQVLSPKAKSSFSQALPLSYGAYYQGWSSYFLGLKIKTFGGTSNENHIFKNKCKAINNAYQSHSSPYLESYYQMVWPGDNMLCVSSLKLYDSIYDSKYTATIDSWLNKVKTRLDTNGLIPHTAHHSTGKPLEGSRGSSQSLILSFLPNIDSSFSKQQYLKYKELFLDERLGLKAIREYPKPHFGLGDIDSGPVIWDIGVVSTVVGQKASINNNDSALANQLYHGLNAFSMPKTTDKHRINLFGIVDIGDLFLAWTRTSLTEKHFKNQTIDVLKFRLISMAYLIIGLGIFIFLVRKKSGK